MITVIAFLISFLLCLLIILTKDVHGRHSFDTNDGVQKFHTSPTPRIGGIPVFISLALMSLCLDAPATAILRPLMIAAVPAFIAGLSEDFSKRVSVRSRFVATMLSGLIAWWVTGYTLNKVEVAGVDLLLASLPLSIAFTAFAVAGIANATNIIDGFNGLASGTVMICLAAFALIAGKVGDTALMQLCLLLILAIAGFFIFNFPFGKIFMGDGGAYLIGFLLAWVGVMLPTRNPTVSKWASLLICSYPIIETLFSMARRFWQRSHPGQPDSGHLHSLIKVKLVRRYCGALSQPLRSSLVSPFSWGIALCTSAIAVAFHNSKPVLMPVSIGAIFVYAVLHGMLVRMRPNSEEEAC